MYIKPFKLPILSATIFLDIRPYKLLYKYILIGQFNLIFIHEVVSHYLLFIRSIHPILLSTCTVSLFFSRKLKCNCKEDRN